MKNKVIAGALVVSCLVNLTLIGVQMVDAKKEDDLSTAQKRLDSYGLLETEIDQERLEKLMSAYLGAKLDNHDSTNIQIQQNWLMMKQNDDILKALKEANGKK